MFIDHRVVVVASTMMRSSPIAVDHASQPDEEEADDDEEDLPQQSSSLSPDWKDDDFISFNDVVENDAKNNNPENKENPESQGEVSHLPPHGEEVPPWMHLLESTWSSSSSSSFSNNHRSPEFPLTQLHNEIVAFAQLMAPLPAEIQARQELISSFRKFVQEQVVITNDGAAASHWQVHVFGSQATGLFLPTSDIDLVILTDLAPEKPTPQGKLPPEEKEEEETASSSSWSPRDLSPMQRLAQALREHWLDQLSYLEVIENTRVPLVKFRHAPTNIAVDVSFDQRSGPHAAQLLLTFIQALPPLRPLTLILKYFLVARGLHQPYTGGVGSYLLQLLVVSFLQHRERAHLVTKLPSTDNLGALLLEFLQLYGLDFNTYTTGVSVRHDGVYFPKGAADRAAVYASELRPALLAVENPLDPSFDVGQASFRLPLVQRSLAVAYRLLVAHLTHPPLSSVLTASAPSPPTTTTTTAARPPKSYLALILPPTPDMAQRLLMMMLPPRRSEVAGKASGAREEEHQASGSARARSTSAFL